MGGLAVGRERWLESQELGKQTQLVSCHTSTAAGWSSSCGAADHAGAASAAVEVKASSDADTKQHLTVVLMAELGMVAAEGNKLFADGASTTGFPFTAFGVLHDPLHLRAGRQRTVGTAALARMYQRLHGVLDAKTRSSPPLYGCFCLLVVALLTQANA